MPQADDQFDRFRIQRQGTGSREDGRGKESGGRSRPDARVQEPGGVLFQGQKDGINHANLHL